MTVLAFQQSVWIGAAILIAASSGGAVAGAALNYIPRKTRRPIQISLALTLLAGMLQNVLRVALAQLGVATDWLYSSRFGGLTYLGAIVVFLLSR